MNTNFALFGGTFDPVHIGHIEMIKFVITSTSINKVIIVPAGKSPFKQNSVTSSNKDRLEMLKLALDELCSKHPELKNKIQISTYELEKSSVSYTSETIEHFKEAYNIRDRINFIIGTDILSNLEKWHNSEYIKNNVSFILLRRKIESFNIEETIKTLRNIGYQITEYKNDIVNVSSTEIRKGNLNLVPKSVKNYILEHNLYKK